MKLFLQAPNDGIVINHEITVTVESIDGDSVCLSIDAPPWVRIASELITADGIDTEKPAPVHN